MTESHDMANLSGTAAGSGSFSSGALPQAEGSGMAARRTGTVLSTVLLVIVGFLVLYPLAMLVYGSFMGGARPGEAGSFSLKGYEEAYGDAETWAVLWTTIWLALLRSFLSVGLGVFLAWVVTRTNTPWRRTLEVLIWLQFFCPYLPMTMAWVQLAAPNVGFLNQLLVWLLPIKQGVFNIYSYWGIIWVSCAHWASVAFFIIAPAFRGMNAALEESSRMCGATRARTFLRITAPILLPSILAAAMVVMVHLMESFEVELLLGYQKGIFVYTTKLWTLLSFSPVDYAVAMPLTMMFLFILFVLIFIQQRLFSGKQGEYVTVTGRGFVARPLDLRGWKHVAFGLTAAYVFFSTILPLGTLIMGSFMRVFGVFVSQPFTLKNWQTMLDDPRLLSSIENTLILAFVAATLGTILYFFISYIVVRSTYPGRHVLNFISWLPWGIPGLVIGLCFLWAYVGGVGTWLNATFGIVIYGSMGLLAVALIVRGLPLGVRALTGSMVQLGGELEESSRVLGASWLTTVRRIVAPLMAPGFFAAWLLVFSLAARNLSAVILLYTPKTRNLAVISFEYWQGGDYGAGLTAGLILTAIVAAVALAGLYLRTRFEIPLRGH
jgi:iron(III) transport system permease protein